MKKTYENPMLQVVSIKRNDVIATSGEPNGTNNRFVEGRPSFAPERNFEWYGE